LISNVSSSLSRGVETSEDVLKDIAEMVAAVDRQVQQNAATASGANRLAVASRDAAHRGYDAATELSDAMAQIRQSGAKIVSVVKLIDDIAFQTNLLALNAAVEAARAGRQGKGFSVVADEVRNLASRSAKAAHETGEMVRSMLTLMESGALLAERSDREFRSIVDIATQVTHLFETIVEASDEQSSAVALIVESLNRISGVIKDNSRNAQEMAMSSTELSRQAEELRRMLSRFQLGTVPTRAGLPYVPSRAAEDG
jgi:methyl-accepting chemotaxis protein